jgi:hypothetical protein
VLCTVLYVIVIYFQIDSSALINIAMISFYLSLFISIIIYSAVFYLWLIKKKKGNIIRIIVLLLALVILCLSFNLVSHHLKVIDLIKITFNCIYTLVILILTVFLIIYIVHKLIVPTKIK